MSDKYISGKITFIHHEKDRVVIEYDDHGKKKNIHGDVDDKAQEKLVSQKIIKKPHRFLIGDHVKFLIKKTGANGRILYADNIRYQYNTSLEILINKAATENKFLGYIKITDKEYFIKEIESYVFFPLKISVFENPPTEKEIEKPVSFKLENIEKPDKITAVLYNHNYIPEFSVLVQHFKKQTTVDAVVYKITPFGIHINLLGDKIKARLSISDLLKKKIDNNTIQTGTLIPVKIKHISESRIVVEEA
jgi:hypothetical protein